MKIQKALGLVFGIFLISPNTYALSVPEFARAILLHHHREDLIVRYEAIPEVSIDEILDSLNAPGTSVLGEGYNGFAIKTADGAVVKILRSVFMHEGSAAERWRRVRQISVLKSLKPALNQMAVQEKAPTAIEKELLGTLLMGIYSPKALLDLPSAISEDHLAFVGRLVPGVSLKKVLGSNSLSESQQRRLWREVISLLNLSETMLLGVGLTFDIINPDNILVSGLPNQPSLTIIDRELIEPSRETYAYYRARGRELPRPVGLKEAELVYWPIFPDHIVSAHVHWKLTFEQAVMYLEERYSVRRDEAVNLLADIPMAPVDFVPGMTDFSHIHRANLTRCNRLLSPEW